MTRSHIFAELFSSGLDWVTGPHRPVQAILEGQRRFIRVRVEER